MNTITMKWVAFLIFVLAALGFTACSSMHGTEEVDAIETPDGAIIVDTFSTTATVLAIDVASRKVTLQATMAVCSRSPVEPTRASAGKSVVFVNSIRTASSGYPGASSTSS